MAMKIGTIVKHAWNAFMNRDPTPRNYDWTVGSSSYHPDRVRLGSRYERTIVASIINRVALDVASLAFQHARLDSNGRYTGPITSGLNECLTISANVDQTGRAFIQDVVMSLLDEGCVAIVPVDTDDDPTKSGTFGIETLRVGKIVEWKPYSVKVEVYDENDGLRKNVELPKSMVAIMENPLYAVMNEPNSTLKRLTRKLKLLDAIDEQSGSGKLDLIIQLPYSIRNDVKKKQAEERRADIERQLTGSKYGIAYIDAAEHVTQLNRAVENNLMKQVEYLTSMLFSQLGITQGVLDGTADDKTMLNYFNRSIEPIASVLSDEMTRKFLTKTARTQGQAVVFFRDPFKLVPVSEIAEIADKFTRNEIVSSNEIRQIIGMKPSEDPAADELRNKNLNQNSESLMPGAEGEPTDPATVENQNGEIDDDFDYETEQDNVVNDFLHGVEEEINRIIGSYMLNGTDEDEEDAADG